MSKKIVATNISSSATERTVKEFFLFCDKIKEFELIKEENSDKQIAYITFEKESGAKTALMLSNAVIGDSQIVVKSADDTSGSDDSFSDDGSTPITNEKSKVDLIAEILAAGYQLQDTIIETGSKYGVSQTFTQYLTQLQSKLQELDDKYKLYEKVTAKASELNVQYNIQDKVKLYASQAQDKATWALETPTGKMAHELYNNTYKQIGDIQFQARKIADEKKAAVRMNGDTNAGIQAH